MSDSQQVQGRRSGASGQTQRDGQAPHVEPDHTSHGQSLAAWTAVTVLLVGALIMCIAVVITNRWVFVAGALVALIGAISGKVLSVMGFGVSGHPGR
jgi:hypothetical protein